MFQNRKIIVIGIVVSLVLSIISLAACSSGASQSNSSSSPQTSGQQAPSLGAQPPSMPANGQPPARMGGEGMETMLNQVAEILGISASEVTSAFEQAQASVFSGQQPEGQPPEPGQQPPQGQPPESGEEPSAHSEGPDMTALYEEMVSILGISADDISAAFEQARQGLQK